MQGSIQLPVSVRPTSRPARMRGRARVRSAWLYVIVGLAIVVLVFAFVARGRGWKTRAFVALGLAEAKQLPPAQFVVTEPADGAVDVQPSAIVDAPILARVRKGRAIDPQSVSETSVHLVRVSDQQQLDADVSLMDSVTIAVRPRSALAPRTQYALYVTPRVRTTDGRPVNAFLSSFTTGGAIDPDLAFEQVSLPVTDGTPFSCVTFGPDGKLWAASIDGRIFRFVVRSDGTLESPQVITTLQSHERGPRLLTGFAFEPGSQPPSIIASHGYFGFEDVPDFTSKISRLSGAELDRVEDLVINLPRSSGDHATNQPSFGPDGALYIPQASNSASGAADAFWNNRDEHLLSATILRLDLAKLMPGKPIDVRTRESGGAYDPSATGAPLTIHAKGVRLAYDLLWHSNGRLYSAVNGASAGGNTPYDSAQSGTAVTGLTAAENDWLLDVTNGGFHGHANPAAGHPILNGANPTERFDVGEVPEYPVGTQPDRAYQKPLLTLGQHISANGVLEYRGQACNGKLDRRILICRYARGSDILVVTVDEHGRVTREDFGLPGLSNLAQPLDIAQDPKTGYLYVSEFGAKKITLCKPKSE